MRLSLMAGFFAALLCTAAAAPRPLPSPTGIPTPASAQQMLGSLTVADAASTSGYSREKFPHWITQNGSCDTREVVLKRDGINVVQDSLCAATSGTWLSPYDGATWNASSDVDIDHLVPLENAWVSGAAKWTTDQRQDFANDLSRPQLWTVTDNINESKGDRSPDQWKPPLQDFWCTYAEAYITVKNYYKLTVTESEKSALQSMLEGC